MNKTICMISKEELRGKTGKEVVAYFKFTANEELMKATGFLPPEASVSERAYCLLNDINNIQLCACGSSLIFEKFNKGYYKSCGQPECSKSARVKSIEKTMVDRYGAHTSKLVSVKAKSKATLEERYGDRNYVNTEKRAKTMLDRYGVSHALKNEEFVKKKKNTQLERYGNENFNNRKQIEQTNLERYGFKNAAKSDDVRNRSVQTFKQNHLKQLNDKITKFNLFVHESVGAHYIVECNVCKTKFDISNCSFNANLRSDNNPCRVCNPYIPTYNSKNEDEIFDFISSIYAGKIIRNIRTLGSKIKELDIYLPELNLAFEHNGVYFHSELFKENRFHLDKTEACEEAGIRLVHIWEDQWNFKKDIVKSRIKNIIGKSDAKVYARNCDVKKLKYGEVEGFLRDNHIQGGNKTGINLGLFFGGALISVMTFKVIRKDQTDRFELIRFCNKLNYQVTGAAGKLFAAFCKEFDPAYVLSYCDRSWSVGNLYETIGMKLSHKTEPGFWYVSGPNRINRRYFVKEKLLKMKELSTGMSEDSEHAIMLKNKIYRIYDAGNYVFEWQKNN